MLVAVDVEVNEHVQDRLLFSIEHPVHQNTQMKFKLNFEYVSQIITVEIKKMGQS